MAYKDKKDEVAASHRWYEKHKDRVVAKNKRHKEVLRKYVIKVREGGCSICGYNKCVAAIEFHHISGKDFDIGIAVSRGYSLDTLKKELNKCIMVCSNCHREIHNPDKITVGLGNES